MAAAVRTSAVGGSSSGTGDRNATITPASGDLLVVYCCVAANTNNAPTCSDNNGGGTYDLIEILNFTIAAVEYRMSVFIRTALMANTTSTVVTVATGSNSSGAVHVLALTGITRTGANAVRSEGSQNNQAAATAAPTLNQAALTNNPTLVAIGSADTTTTPPTNWTEIQDTNFANDTVALETAFRASGFTGTTITFGAAQSTQFCAHAMELDTTVLLTQSPADDVNNLADARGLGYGNLHSDSVANLADSATIVMGHVFSFSESVNNLADGPVRVIGMLNPTQDSLQALTDALARLLTYQLALTDSEAANWADSHQLLLANFLALSDLYSLSDATTLQSNSFLTLSDTIPSLTDSFAFQLEQVIELADTLDSLSDSLTINYGLALSDSTDGADIARPNILFIEAGGASTGGTHLYDAIGGVPTVDTVIKPTGAYSSIKCGIGQWIRKGGTSNVLFNLTGRISFYFYAEALPSGPENILLVEDSSASPDPTLDLRIRADGLLAFHPVDGSSETVGTHAISAGTDYRICVSFNENSTVDNLDTKIYIDGVEDISVTAQPTNGIHGGVFRFLGPNTDGGPFHFAHVYVDEGDDLTDTGNVQCTAKFPATVNQDDFDTTGGTGAVNERPLDEANYRQQAGSTQAHQNYTLESASAGDMDISGSNVVGVMGWIWTRKSSPFSGGSPSITVDGVDYALGGVIATTPGKILRPVTQSTYPSDAAGIGLVSGGTGTDYYLYECGVVVASITGVVPAGLADSLTYDLVSIQGPNITLELSSTLTAFSDSLVLGYGLQSTDALTLTDAISLLGNELLSLADTVSLTDSETHTLDLRLAFTETISLTDSLTSGYGLLFSDSFTLIDTLAIRLDQFVSVADALTLTDSESHLLGQRASFTDDINLLVDSVAFRLGQLLDLADSTPALTDARALELSYRLLFSDAISLTDDYADDLINTVEGTTEEFADDVNLLTDRLALGFGIALNDSVTSLLDTESHTLGQLLALNDSTATLLDSVSLQLHQALDFSDSLTLTDNHSLLLGQLQSLTDTLTSLSDAEANQLEQRLSFAESIDNLTDTLALTLAQLLSLSDPLSLTDSTQLGYGLLFNDDTNSLIDSITTSAPQGPLRQVGVTDSVDNLADSFALRLDYLLAVADTTSLSDSLALNEGLFAAFTDVLSLTDTTTSTLGHLVPLVDSLALTDLIQLRLGYELTLADIITLTDNTTLNLSYSLTLTDNASLLADSVAKSLGLTLIITDNAPTLTDAISLFSAWLLQLSDAFALTDSLAKSSEGFLPLADSFALTDSVAIELRGPDLDESVSDTLALTDAISLTLGNELQLRVVISDLLTLTDHYFDLRHPYTPSTKRYIVVPSRARTTTPTGRRGVIVPASSRTARVE